jgi:hypothetical protein
MLKAFRWQSIIAGVVLWNIQGLICIWLNGAGYAGQTTIL